jgi:uncharacterized damage-inducible protein DinB
MPSYLDELYAHQEWADAEHWRAFEAHGSALADRAIRERLLHIHLVQSAFLWVIGSPEKPFAMKKIEDYPDMTDLKTFARGVHADLLKLRSDMAAARLEETVEVPWFRPALKISVRHALMQVSMHSHHHRGQNATRFRELGGVPPGTDFIEWLRQGQPAAKWE